MLLRNPASRGLFFLNMEPGWRGGYSRPLPSFCAME